MFREKSQEWLEEGRMGRIVSGEVCGEETEKIVVNMHTEAFCVL